MFVFRLCMFCFLSFLFISLSFFCTFSVVSGPFPFLLFLLFFFPSSHLLTFSPRITVDDSGGYCCCCGEGRRTVEASCARGNTQLCDVTNLHSGHCTKSASQGVKQAAAPSELGKQSPGKDGREGRRRKTGRK